MNILQVVEISGAGVRCKVLINDFDLSSVVHRVEVDFKGGEAPVVRLTTLPPQLHFSGVSARVEVNREEATDQDIRVLSLGRELLDALRGMVDGLGVDGHGTPFEAGECPEVDLARAVIAKAEGRNTSAIDLEGTIS